MDHLALGEAIKADHGFTMDSQAVRDLIAIVSEYDEQSRRRFLQFITGSPRLPIGGKCNRLIIYFDTIMQYRFQRVKPGIHSSEKTA